MKTGNGLTISHRYFEDEDTQRSIMNRVTRDEARRVAANEAGAAGARVARLRRA